MDSTQWNWFMTPSTTPTDATFSPSALQTPKSSHQFQEAISPFNTNHNASHTNAFAPGPPIDASMFSIDTPEAASHQHGTAHSQEMVDQEARPPPRHTGAATFRPAQKTVAVHTPPPTRNLSEKKRAPRPHSVMFGTPTPFDQMMMNGHVPQLIDHSRTGTLSQSASQPILPIAMDFVPFTTMVNQEAQAHQWGAPMPCSMDGSYVVPPGAALADPFTYQAQNINIGPNAEQNGFVQQASHPFAPVHASPVQQAPVVPSNAAGSFSHQPASNDRTQHRASQMLPPAQPQYAVPSPQPSTHDSLSPESQPQRSFPSPAAVLASNQLAMQPEVVSPRPPTSGGLKSGLRRSNTTETRRPHTMYGSIDSLMRSNTTSGIQRKGSPLKRFNRNSTASLASIAESTPSVLPRSRTSIVLTVDSKGRARTETRNIDMSPTRSSIKSRYPSLWDDSDSDSDSDVTIASNNRQSFCAPPRSEDRNRRAKLDSTLASLEGLHLPRSTSSASNKVTPSKAAIAAAVQLRRQSSVKKSYHSRRNTNSHVATADSDMRDAESDSDSGNGDAGAALRKAIERRDQHREAAAARQSARSRPQSMSSRPGTSSFPPRTSSLASLGPSSFNAVPMPMHNGFGTAPLPHVQAKSSPVKPSGTHADVMSSVTRCICNLPLTENQLMLQCTACSLWSHAACVGIPPEQVMQPWFCTYCMHAAGIYPQTSMPHPMQQSERPPPQHFPNPGAVGWEAAAF